MRVAVIGGGISGIASAHYLLQRHVKVDLYESEAHIGGRIGNELLQGRSVDIGGKNVGKHYHQFRSLAKAYGNPDYEYFGINTSQLVGSKIVTLSRDGKKLSNLLNLLYLSGTTGILQLYPHIRTVLTDRSQGAIGTDYYRKISDRFDHLTLADFLSRRCVDHIARPITVRMNGAEPNECYPGNLGSNLAVALDSFEQLKSGMHTVIEVFRSISGKGALQILENHRVTKISSLSGSNSVEIEYIHQGKIGSATYEKVISALPAHCLAAVLEQNYPEVSCLLRQIRYFPVAISIVKYRYPVFNKSHRAMIFDQSSPLSNIGAYGMNDLDVVRYTFSGKRSREVVSAQSSPEEIIALGEKTASSYFAIEQNQKEAFVYRYLPEGLCAFSARHHVLIERIDKELDQMKGFAATGDFRRGASIEACCRAAEECVNITTGVNT